MGGRIPGSDCVGKLSRGPTYQIRQRIQLLPHQAALPSPPRHLPIHEVEEKPKRHESERCPYWAVGVCGAEAVSHGAEDGHKAAKAWSMLR